MSEKDVETLIDVCGMSAALASAIAWSVAFYACGGWYQLALGLLSLVVGRRCFGMPESRA